MLKNSVIDMTVQSKHSGAFDQGTDSAHPAQDSAVAEWG